MKALQILLAVFTLSLLLVSCSDDETPNMNPNNDMFNIWDGPNLTFTKDSGADVNDPANQDRITDDVWITRGNEGGQIFNIKSENNASKANSPSGTLWAVGSINNIGDLQFQSFRNAVSSPKDVVGKNLVMYLVEADVYLSVQFTQWSQGKSGGFSYQRATQN